MKNNLALNPAVVTEIYTISPNMHAVRLHLMIDDETKLSTELFTAPSMEEAQRMTFAATRAIEQYRALLNALR